MEMVLEDSIYLILYLFAWFMAYKWQKKFTNNSYGPSKLLVTLYLVLSIATLVLYTSNWDKEMWVEPLTFFPFVYLFFMIMLAAFPVFLYDHDNVTSIQKPSNLVITAFLILYTASVLFTLPNEITRIQEGLSVMLVSEEGGADLYNSMEEKFLEESTGTASIITRLLSVTHNIFGEVGIMIFFYYLSLPEKKKWLVVLLGIDILVSTILPFAGGGRTNGTMMVLNLCVGYFIFREFWNEQIRRRIKKYAVIFLVIVSIPFTLLTASRWMLKTSDETPLQGVFRYVGEAPLYFNMYALDAGGTRNGDRILNLPKKWLGFTVPDNFRETRDKYSSMKLDDTFFSTFVGDFVLDFGPIMAVIIFIFFTIFFIFITKSHRHRISFHGMIALYYVMCVCVQGSFYLFFYSYHLGWRNVGFILAYIIFFFDYNLNKGHHKYLVKNG